MVGKINVPSNNATQHAFSPAWRLLLEIYLRGQLVSPQEAAGDPMVNAGPPLLACLQYIPLG